MSNIQNAIIAILNDNPELVFGSETSKGRKRLKEVYASSRMQDINNRTSRGQPLSERDLEFLSGVSDLEKQVQVNRPKNKTHIYLVGGKSCNMDTPIILQKDYRVV